jgi:hypothetical protein
MNLILVSFYRTEPKSPFINGTDAVRRNRRHPMKMILAAAAFAALIASPLYAQSPRYEGPVSGIYLNQQKRFGVNNRSLPAPRFNQISVPTTHMVRTTTVVEAELSARGFTELQGGLPNCLRWQGDRRHHEPRRTFRIAPCHFFRKCDGE